MKFKYLDAFNNGEHQRFAVEIEKKEKTHPTCKYFWQYKITDENGKTVILERPWDEAPEDFLETAKKCSSLEEIKAFGQNL